MLRALRRAFAGAQIALRLCCSWCACELLVARARSACRACVEWIGVSVDLLYKKPNRLMCEQVSPISPHKQLLACEREPATKICILVAYASLRPKTDNPLSTLTVPRQEGHRGHYPSSRWSFSASSV